jgi:hypothetical protein
MNYTNGLKVNKTISITPPEGGSVVFHMMGDWKAVVQKLNFATCYSLVAPLLSLSTQQGVWTFQPSTLAASITPPTAGVETQPDSCPVLVAGTEIAYNLPQ